MTRIVNFVLNDFNNDSRVLKTSKSLAAMGYQVTVVAIHNDKLKRTELVDGFSVDRIKLRSRSWPKWKPVQFLKYLEFIVRAVWHYRRVDFAHCNDLNALPAGVLIKLFRRNVKIIYDCHEYETETNGVKGSEKKIKKFLERILIRYADRIITVSDSIANEYVRLYSVTKPYLVLNCPSFKEQPKQDLFRENLGIREDQTIFLYQGALNKGRGIELIIDAFSGLETDRNVLVFMGYGSLENLIREKARKIDVVFFHPAVKPDVLLKYTSSADYGIAFIEDSCLSYRYCLPNKMFEYLMAGLPVLTSNLCQMRRLVNSEGVGIVAKDNTVEGVRKAVSSSLEQNYSAVQENVFKTRKKYCWEEQEKVIEEVYRNL